jgi:hypothetical protein
MSGWSARSASAMPLSPPGSYTWCSCSRALPRTVRWAQRGECLHQAHDVRRAPVSTVGPAAALTATKRTGLVEHAEVVGDGRLRQAERNRIANTRGAIATPLRPYLTERGEEDRAAASRDCSTGQKSQARRVAVPGGPVPDAVAIDGAPGSQAPLDILLDSGAKAPPELRVAADDVTGTPGLVVHAGRRSDPRTAARTPYGSVRDSEGMSYARCHPGPVGRCRRQGG